MINDFYNRNFPVLELEDAYFLREQCPDDAKTFYEYYSDPLVSQYILATKPKDITDAHEEISYCRNLFYYKRGLYWTIARTDNNQMIGAIGLYVNNQHHRAEICYDLSRAYWRQGIITKAIQRVLDYAFKHMNIFRIEALTVKENTPSIRALTKLGFLREATLKNYRYFENKSHDVEMYAISLERYCQLGDLRKDYANQSEMMESKSG